MNEGVLGFYTVQEFSKLTRIQPRYIYTWIKEKKIKAIQISGGKRNTWRIPKTELERLQALAYDEEEDEGI